MPEHLSELRPYRSLVIGEVRSGVRLGPIVDGLLDEAVSLLAELGDRVLVNSVASSNSGGLVVSFAHFVESREASWTLEPGAVDQINHLVVICRRKSLVAVYSSDPKLKAAIQRLFRGSVGAFGRCDPISRGRMNEAFVKGATRTLWLSGTHRRVSAKPDSKVLAGLDLRDSLDPLDDQSYYFSAARSIPPELAVPVGATPGKSAVWSGPSRDWPEFRDGVLSILDHLASTTTEDDRPLPVLASRIQHVTDVGPAFDISFQPPESLADPSVESEAREEAERLAYGTVFEIVEAGPPIRTDVTVNGRPIGSVVIDPDFTDLQRIACAVQAEPASAEVEKELAVVVQHCRNSRWLKIRFDSGHTLSDGALYGMHFRDVPFRGLKYVDLSGFNLKQEKPDPITAVGKGQKSLFDWTYEFWPNLDNTTGIPGGWLASDDGSMEIADFIHLDETTNQPMLSLIHVKGAGSAEPGRGVSVSSYEVVTGQAVKNLRHLDQLLLAKGLGGKKALEKKISKLVWQDRERSNRSAMIERLVHLGADYERQVVIIQPHVTKARVTAARQNPERPEGLRLRQLDALLLGAEAACRGLGADLVVVTAKH